MTTDPASNNARAYSNRIGLMADSPNFPAEWNSVMEKVRIADELGYDSIWLGESWGYELFTSMADLVRVTKRIKIGAGIANIYSRTPALIASTIATLDERSDGVLPVYWPANKWGELRSQLDEGARIAGRPAHSAAIAPYITSVILSEQADENERAAARFTVASPLAYYIGRMGVYYAQMLIRDRFGP